MSERGHRLRIAVLSDIHSNFIAFEAVLRDVEQMAPDAIVYLGDAVLKGPQPKECIDRLRDLHPEAIVRGNYDHMFTRFPPEGWQPLDAKSALIAEDFAYHQDQLPEADQAWLANLPTAETMTVEGMHIDMFHAAPDSLYTVVWPWAPNETLMALFQDERTEVVLFGHVHHGFIRHAEGRLIVNAGSIGLPFDGDPRACYAIVDMEKGSAAAQLRRVPYNIDQAIQKAETLNMPGTTVFAEALRHAAYPPY